MTWKCTALPSSELVIIELICLREIFVPPLNAKQVSSRILPLLVHLPPLPWCLENSSQFETWACGWWSCNVSWASLQRISLPLNPLTDEPFSAHGGEEPISQGDTEHGRRKNSLLSKTHGDRHSTALNCFVFKTLVILTTEFHETSFYSLHENQIQISKKSFWYCGVNNYCLVLGLLEISVKMPKYFD